MPIDSARCYFFLSICLSHPQKSQASLYFRNPSLVQETTWDHLESSVSYGIDFQYAKQAC
jgi:hypothetical protein